MKRSNLSAFVLLNLFPMIDELALRRCGQLGALQHQRRRIEWRLELDPAIFNRHGHGLAGLREFVFDFFTTKVYLPYGEAKTSLTKCILKETPFSCSSVSLFTSAVSRPTGAPPESPSA